MHRRQRTRAAAEAWEEAGFKVSPQNVEFLGGPFFVAPGILSEKIFPTAVDVTGLEQHVAPGDGSPLEEGGLLRWRTFEEVLAACVSGELIDAKTEISLNRLITLKKISTQGS